MRYKAGFRPYGRCKHGRMVPLGIGATATPPTVAGFAQCPPPKKQNDNPKKVFRSAGRTKQTIKTPTR